MGQVQDSLDPMGHHESHERWRVALLVFSFALSFLFACSLLLVIGHYGLNAPRSLWPFGSNSVTAVNRPAGEPPFTPFTVSHNGAYIKATVADSANPTGGEDFAFLIWFKLRKAPATGEALGVVGKFDSEVHGRPGYAISLEGAPDGIRPRVYLSSGDTPGRWYSFSSYPMNRRDWYLLAVSLVDDTFVTASLGRAFAKEGPVLLGGHRISGANLPHSKADVVVGAYGASRFRGQIGPFGVLSGRDLAESLPKTLALLQVDPGSLPDVQATEMVRLWGSPLEDRGPRRANLVQVHGETASTVPKGRTAKPRAVQPPKRIKPSKKTAPEKTKARSR